MNTTPDEALLALWLDDELHGEELVRVEAWALTQPHHLAMREEIRSFRTMISSALPAEVEPPYADFFNSRIEQAIRGAAAKEAPVKAKASLWRSWLFPSAALAGMALAFWIGTKANAPVPVAPSVAKNEEPAPAPVYYTPEQGVEAKWVNGKNSSATVIVLQGVSAIPDALDFSQAVSYQTPDGPGAAVETVAAEEGKAAR